MTFTIEIEDKEVKEKLQVSETPELMIEIALEDAGFSTAVVKQVR